jgi:hypothetical protein
VFQLLKKADKEWIPRVHRGVLMMGLLLAAVIGFGQSASLNLSPAASAAHVIIGTTCQGPVIGEHALGFNTNMNDQNLLTAKSLSLLKASGATVFRLPGGSNADVYQWQTNTLTKGAAQGDSPPLISFATLEGRVVKPISGGVALVTVNYGGNATGNAGGSPLVAAQWAHYALVHRDPVIGWEIGNEQYSNGEYGANNDWEVDDHQNHSPAAYGANSRVFIADIHRKDPGARVGVMLVAPGNWPSWLKPYYNQALLSQLRGTRLGFVSIHWYPGYDNDRDAPILRAPQDGGSPTTSSTPSIAVMMHRLRLQLKQYLGYVPPIWVTETNSVSSAPGNISTSQANALFLVESELDWRRNGAGMVVWYDWHDGLETDGSNLATDSDTNFGDYGVLSQGQSSQGIHEPPANTPFPDYYGFVLTARAAQPGSRFLALTASPNASLGAYALREPNRSLTLVLINRSSRQPVHVTVAIPRAVDRHQTGREAIDTWQHPNAVIHRTFLATSVNGTLRLTVPPYAIVELTVTSAAASHPTPSCATTVRGKGLNRGRRMA